MGFLFKAPKVQQAPSPTSPTSKQEAIQEKQEERIKKQTSDEQKKIAARLNARRTGGYRSLLSPDRQDAMRGLGTTLTGGTES